MDNVNGVFKFRVDKIVVGDTIWVREQWRRVTKIYTNEIGIISVDLAPHANLYIGKDINNIHTLGCPSSKDALVHMGHLPGFSTPTHQYAAVAASRLHAVCKALQVSCDIHFNVKSNLWTINIASAAPHEAFSGKDLSLSLAYESVFEHLSTVNVLGYDPRYIDLVEEY